jgi:long-chain fatty acid transport protein
MNFILIFQTLSSMQNKKNLLLLFCLLTSAAVKAQMDNLSNMSVKWIASPARYAATDEADIVNYNPAGVVRLSDGFHLNLSNQTLIRKPKHTFNLGTGDQTYGQDGIDPFLPNMYMAYKKNNWAMSSGIYISGGGATVNYPEGSINTTMLGYKLLSGINTATGAQYRALTAQSLKASSYYLTIPLQFALAVNDQWSFAFGGRYILGINSTSAGVTIGNSAVGAPDTPIGVDYKENAAGFGGVIGVFYQPTDKLGLSLHYESKVKLDFKTKDNAGSYTLIADGAKNRRDLPATLCAGVSYQLTDQLTGAADFSYCFQKNADWGTITYKNVIYDASDAAGDSYTAGIGFTYETTKKLQFSAGCKYTRFMYDNQELYYTKLGLYEVVKYNNIFAGLGAAYKVSKKLQIELAGGRTTWKDKQIQSLNAGIPVNVKDVGYVLAVGIDLTL